MGEGHHVLCAITKKSRYHPFTFTHSVVHFTKNNLKPDSFQEADNVLSTGAVREALTMSRNECLSTGAVREADNVSQ